MNEIIPELLFVTSAMLFVVRVTVAVDLINIMRKQVPIEIE